MVEEVGETNGTVPTALESAHEPDWNAIRADYEGRNGTLDTICKRHGITRSALRYRGNADLWAKRNAVGRDDRTVLIDRMFRLLDRQIRQLEKPMDDNGEKTELGDKEVALLGNMARTLEKLIEIDNATRASKTKGIQSKDIKDLRAKLAKRIDQLKSE